MKHLLKWLIVGSVLSGCATAPDENHWAGIEVSSDPAVRPDPLPDRPDVIVRDDGLLLDGDAVRALDEYFIAAEEAEDIAHAHADQIDELRKASQALVEAGEAQYALSEVRREIVEEERRQHGWEKAGLYAIILAVLGIAATD